jgi:hypothetical protein
MRVIITEVVTVELEIPHRKETWKFSIVWF